MQCRLLCMCYPVRPSFPTDAELMEYRTFIATSWFYVLGDCQKEEGKAGMSARNTHLAIRQQLYLNPSSRRWSNRSKVK